MTIWFGLWLSIVAGSDAVAQDIVVKGNRRSGLNWQSVSNLAIGCDDYMRGGLV
jgi:hypothetical protein